MSSEGLGETLVIRFGLITPTTNIWQRRCSVLKSTPRRAPWRKSRWGPWSSPVTTETPMPCSSKATWGSLPRHRQGRQRDGGQRAARPGLSVPRDRPRRRPVVPAVRAHSRYLGGTEDRIACFAQSISPAEKWNVHLAVHPQVNVYSISRKRYAHLSAERSELAGTATVPWAWTRCSLSSTWITGITCRPPTPLPSRARCPDDQTGHGHRVHAGISRGKVAFRDATGQIHRATGPTGTMKSGKSARVRQRWAVCPRAKSGQWCLPPAREKHLHAPGWDMWLQYAD